MMEVEVPSFAKLNLDLRVLHKRPDEFHEIRTIFQTISLRDTLGIECRLSKRSEIALDSSIEIADNLVVRAAHAVLERLGKNASVRFRLRKKIPMGAGLGGGSSNAAAVLLALPALLDKSIRDEDLVQLAETLGSDVPFFLMGGTAVGLGRGTELYPLPDLRRSQALVIASGIHVSTPGAYRSLDRPTNALTSPARSPILREFQAVVWGLGNVDLEDLPLRNDFEEAVFETNPKLRRMARKLRRLGADPVRMTGSGSALFGLFRTTAQVHAAVPHFAGGSAHPVRFISRLEYQKIWRRALGRAAERSRFAHSV